jgi:hypothetical protein
MKAPFDRPAKEGVPTALYRHFDDEGRLLYVGISLSPTYRLSQHRVSSSWFVRISRISVEWFHNRDTALEALQAGQIQLRGDVDGADGKPIHSSLRRLAAALRAQNQLGEQVPL